MTTTCLPEAVEKPGMSHEQRKESFLRPSQAVAGPLPGRPFGVAKPSRCGPFVAGKGRALRLMLIQLCALLAACTDTPGWTNQFNARCSNFVTDGHCTGNGFAPGHEWAGGPAWATPAGIAARVERATCRPTALRSAESAPPSLP